jgi:ABC-type branched-subunit amino acid transport system substrate-binding protein
LASADDFIDNPMLLSMRVQIPSTAKHCIVFFGFCLVPLVLVACVTQGGGPGISTVPEIREPGDPLFEQGRQAYQQGTWEIALGRLSTYLAHYPQGRHAQEALFLMADVYRQQEQYEASQAFFERLLAEFPDGPYAEQARLALIDLMIAANRRDDALSIASQLLKGPVSGEPRTSMLQRVYRLYYEDGDYGNAGYCAYTLYRTVPESEKVLWAEHFIENTAVMSREDIETLWDYVDDHEMRSYLIYRFAMLHVMNEAYDKAFEMFSLFQHQYPQHPYSEEAAALIETLVPRLTFEPFTIGCLLPLSGPYALYGQRALRGIELSLGIIQQGEHALPIKLLVKDTASEDEQTVRAVRELADAGVAAIIGPIISASAAAGEAQRLQIPIVAITQKAGITQIGDYIFRQFITPQNQVRTLVDYFINSIGLTEFAVLYPQETYGKTFLGYFWDEIIRQGGHVVGVESYKADQTDFAVPIKKLVGAFYDKPADLDVQPMVRREESPYFRKTVPFGGGEDSLEDLLPDPVARLTGLFFQSPDQDRAKGPDIGRIRQSDDINPIIDFDVLFIPDAPKMAGLIIPQLAYYDIRDVYLAGTNLWHSSQLIEMSRDYLQNAVLVDGFFKDSTSEVVRRFVDNYHQVYGQDPGIIEAFAFDIARYLFDLISQPSIRMRHQLRDALVNIFYENGVTGQMAFDENREPVKQLTLLRVKGGRFTEIPQP